MPSACRSATSLDLVYSFRLIRHFERADRIRLYRQIAGHPEDLVDGWSSMLSTKSCRRHCGPTPSPASTCTTTRCCVRMRSLKNCVKRNSSWSSLDWRTTPATGRWCSCQIYRGSPLACAGARGHGGVGQARRGTTGVGRRLPPRVTYWTGTWDPAKEAISKEIAALRVGPARARACRVVLSGPVKPIRPPASRHLLSGRAWPVLRVVAALVEPRAEVTHIFGGQSSWHLLRALGRRPIVLTAVLSRKR